MVGVTKAMRCLGAQQGLCATQARLGYAHKRTFFALANAASYCFKLACRAQDRCGGCACRKVLGGTDCDTQAARARLPYLCRGLVAVENMVLGVYPDSLAEMLDGVLKTLFAERGIAQSLQGGSKIAKRASLPQPLPTQTCHRLVLTHQANAGHASHL